MERNQAHSGQGCGDAGVAVSTVGHTSAVASQELPVGDRPENYGSHLAYKYLDTSVQKFRSRMSSYPMVCGSSQGRPGTRSMQLRILGLDSNAYQYQYRKNYKYPMRSPALIPVLASTTQMRSGMVDIPQRIKEREHALEEESVEHEPPLGL